MFVNPWRERNVRALEALGSLDWAQALLKRVRPLGITLKADDTLFELRYAHDLARAGVTPVYEHLTGVGNSAVDFKLPGKVPWLVELVSIRESDAMKAATTKGAFGPRIRTETLLLASSAGISDPSKKKQTQQEELLRVVNKLGEKVYDKKTRKPIKFPVPDGSAFHMLLVDMRGFEGIAGDPDRDHCRQIVGARVHEPLNVARHADTWEPILGVWDAGNSTRAAELLRERIHVIGFVHEQLYCDDEIRDITLPFINAALFPEKERFRDLYPLDAGRRLDLPARAENSLWEGRSDG